MEKQFETLETYLNDWKAKAIEFYLEDVKRLSKAMSEFNANGELKGMQAARERYNLEMSFAPITRDLRGRGTQDRLERVEIQVERKRKEMQKNFEERVAKYCGTELQVEYLSIKEDGRLYGRVHGNQGSATIDTVLAGGYNVQCLHYRILVKPIKTK